MSVLPQTHVPDPPDAPATVMPRPTPIPCRQHAASLFQGSVNGGVLFRWARPRATPLKTSVFAQGPVVRNRARAKTGPVALWITESRVDVRENRKEMVFPPAIEG